MDRSLLIFLASGLAIERSFTTASTAISKAWLVGTGVTGGGGYWVWSGHARGLVWSGLVWSVFYTPPPTYHHSIKSNGGLRAGGLRASGLLVK